MAESSRGLGGLPRRGVGVAWGTEWDRRVGGRRVKKEEGPGSDKPGPLFR